MCQFAVVINYKDTLFCPVSKKQHSEESVFGKCWDTWELQSPSFYPKKVMTLQGVCLCVCVFSLEFFFTLKWAGELGRQKATRLRFNDLF